MARIIAIANQKGGVGKTTTTHNLGVALVRKGKSVLLIDMDPQDGNLTASLGYEDKAYEISIANILYSIINNVKLDNLGILSNKEGVDLIPCNGDMNSLELSGKFKDKKTLKIYVEMVKNQYDFILIDCPPTLGLTTINAFVAADSVIIPTEAAYLPAKGMGSLIKIIQSVQRTVNKNLKIEGILITRVDTRCAFPMQMVDLFHLQYGSSIKIFNDFIPSSIKIVESSAMGVSNFKHNPSGKATLSYINLAEEVLRYV